MLNRDSTQGVSADAHASHNGLLGATQHSLLNRGLLDTDSDYEHSHQYHETITHLRTLRLYQCM